MIKSYKFNNYLCYYSLYKNCLGEICDILILFV